MAGARGVRMAGRWKQDQAMLNKPVGSFSSALACFEVLRFNRKDERKASKEYEGIEGDLINIYIYILLLLLLWFSKEGGTCTALRAIGAPSSISEYLAMCCVD